MLCNVSNTESIAAITLNLAYLVLGAVSVNKNRVSVSSFTVTMLNLWPGRSNILQHLTKPNVSYHDIESSDRIPRGCTPMFV